MKQFVRIINSMLIFFAANAYSLNIIKRSPYLAAILAVCLILINLFPSFYNRKRPTRKLRICGDGAELLNVFLISTLLTTVYLIVRAYQMLPGAAFAWAIGLFIAVVVEAIVFWNGIIRVYCTSAQLGIKWRVIGLLCGWIPVLHLFALFKIIRVVTKEVAFESEKILVDRARGMDQICRTKYPLLLVHGVFFRDFKYLNYWGRIPEELKKNGAVLYYGNHQSALSVEDSAKEIAERIHHICEETGCGKVNIIAHSKGGLDCRYAVSKCGVGNAVASLTTINTPHRGCLFADYLLSKIPQSTRNFIAQKYNAALKKFGDSNPDFLAAVSGLTASSCKQLNDTVSDIPGVFYQSVGSKLNRANGGRFPLNFSYHLVKYFDGPNDGLVSADSFAWGEKNTLLTVPGNRGISHGDMIDLNRENMEGFDAREFYVRLVHDLKARGL